MKKRRHVRTIAAATLALALTGCAGQAETDDQRVWLNAAEGQATTVVTQEAAKPTEVTTIPTEPTLPEETQIPETTEFQKMQQETTEVTVPLPAETEPLNEESFPPETVPQTLPPTFQTEPEETVPPETQPRETEPSETIPKETEPPETEPEPESSGDIYSAAEAMAVGNSYAASVYGMKVSPELGFGNASYEFADTAYVSGLKVLGGQSYLNQMVIGKIDSLVANLRGAYGADTDISAYRVNCYVAYDPYGELYWIYVFYG